jgi:transketolase
MGKLEQIKQRILDISKERKLSHVGSCISCLPVLDEIFTHKKQGDRVILDNGHAGLALYCFLEAYEGLNAEEILDHHSIHPDKCEKCHLDASTGSLGHGIGIGIGIALQDRDKTVYVMVSDGSMMEGSNWEALRIKNESGLVNLKIYCNFNGYSATAVVNRDKMAWQMKEFCPDIKVFNTENGEGLWGIKGHYITI